MMGSGISKAPWTVGDNKYIYDANGENIAYIVQPKKNARLIAAAPELLDMLETIENDAGTVPVWLWNKIQDAIAKAGGRDKPKLPIDPKNPYK